jgi:nitrate reductase NapAB chaperone NapD
MDSAKVLVQAEKQTDVQKDQYSHIWYIPRVLYIRQTYRQTDRQTDRTDRQDRQKRMTNRPTNRQTDSI